MSSRIPMTRVLSLTTLLLLGASCSNQSERSEAPQVAEVPEPVVEAEAVVAITEQTDKGTEQAKARAAKTLETLLSEQSPESQAEGLIWSNGFEEGQFQFAIGGRPSDIAGPKWAQGQFQDMDYSVEFVETPVRSGSKALRLEWRKSGLRKENTSKKAMIHFGKVDSPQETDRWYGFSLYLPSDAFPVDPYNVVLFQLHATPDQHLKEPWRQPILGLSLRDGILRSGGTYDLEKISPKNDNIIENRDSVELCTIADLWDRWTEFVIHARLSMEGEGSLQVWMDGKLVLERKNINLGYNDVIGPYPSWGIYSYNSSEEKRVLYLDEIRIGDAHSDYESVSPGKADGTALPGLPVGH